MAFPSEYIFRTQLENLEKITGRTPRNISFVTFAKLTYFSEKQINLLSPDYIILDEFYRCGAKGVEALLQAFPNVPLLGLSATPTRYLDGQRAMDQELFDGHIASKITLSEAIVRGILPSPTYVIGIYSHQKALEKYQKLIIT